MQAGLDSAIVHASRIMPIARIPASSAGRAGPGLRPAGRRRATTRWPGCSSCSTAWTPPRSRPDRAAELAGLPLWERLKRRIIDGERNGLEADLDEALTPRPALEIVNDVLLDGMKTVGELFGSGQMQLPFVLQSAEVMKTAVGYLEPHMERSDDGGQGHDRAGHGQGRRARHRQEPGRHHPVQQRLRRGQHRHQAADSAILEAADDHDADVIGMSGLLVKSTVVMRDNLEELNSRGHGRPLAGAARRRRADPVLRGAGPGQRCSTARCATRGTRSRGCG